MTDKHLHEEDQKTATMFDLLRAARQAGSKPNSGPCPCGGTMHVWFVSNGHFRARCEKCKFAAIS